MIFNSYSIIEKKLEEYFIYIYNTISTVDTVILDKKI